MSTNFKTYTACLPVLKCMTFSGFSKRVIDELALSADVSPIDNNAPGRVEDQADRHRTVDEAPTIATRTEAECPKV